MVIASSANQKIAFLRSLINQKKARKEHRLFIVEGATLYKETPSLLIQETFVREGEEALISLASTKDAPVHVVSQKVFDSLSDTVTPSGIMAIVKKAQPNSSLGNSVLLLDGVMDPGNVGTLIRTAAGFEMDSVVLVDSAEAYSPKVVRSAMGAVFSLNIVETDREGSIALLGDRTVYALDMGGVDLKSVTVAKDYVIAVGNEAHGISKEIEDRADCIVAIKAKGIESLNAAVAGSIAMFHFSNQK